MTTRSVRGAAGRARPTYRRRPIRRPPGVPGDELAAGVKARLDVMRRHRPELAAGQIVLAGPDQLDRLADRLGEPHGIDNDLVLAAPSVAATEKMLVEGDVGALGLQQAGDLVVHVGRALGAGPDLDRLAVGTDRGGGVHRLHLGVIDVAGAVFAPVDLGGAPHRGLGVADGFVRYAARLLSRPITANSSSAARCRVARPALAPVTLSRFLAACVASTLVPTTPTPSGSFKMSVTPATSGPVCHPPFQACRPDRAIATPRHRPSQGPGRPWRTWRHR